MEFVTCHAEAIPSHHNVVNPTGYPHPKLSRVNGVYELDFNLLVPPFQELRMSWGTKRLACDIRKYDISAWRWR
jgi:hypothetical protein